MIERLLHEDHLKTLSTINALESRLAGGNARRLLDPANAADAALIAGLLAMFDRETGQHFRFEEEHLFPRLEQVGFCQVTAMLAQEHALIRELAATLRALIEDAGTARLNQDAWDRFREAGSELVDTAMFHIQKEEMGIIARLGMFLGEDERQQLAEVYRA